ncbi:MAG: MarR family transcriptional regulator [Verrucomicrobiota bacterium]
MPEERWPPLEKNPGFVINRTAYIMRSFLTRVFQQHGYSITPEEWVLLNRLWSQDGLNQGALANLAIRDRTTVTRILDGLVRKGYVRREPDPEDRRVVCAWLTRKGRALQGRLMAIALGLKDRVIGGIPREDMEATLRTLYRIQANIQKVTHEM